MLKKYLGISILLYASSAMCASSTPTSIGGYSSATSLGLPLPVCKDVLSTYKHMCNRTEQQKSNLVRIYHQVGFVKKDCSDPMSSIRKHGLLTFKDMQSKGLVQKTRYPCLPDHDDNVYFRYYPDKPPFNSNYVVIDVDPDTTYVYNQELRANGDSKRYIKSKIPLSQFIELTHEIAYLRKSEPNKAIMRCRTTSQPYTVPDEAEILNESYINEIIIPHSIPPEELIFPEENAELND